MFQRMILRVGRHVTQARGHVIFLYFLTASFLIRLPFFFRDYIDRDESTFILVAQSLVEGHLPYTELWDLKPPLVFLLFAGPIWLFGKSFIAIRALGLLAVTAIAYSTYRIGSSLYGKTAGFPAGLLCLFLMSLFGSVQGVMSEHLSMAFMLPAVWQLIYRKTARGYFVAGLLLGLTVLAKSNLAVALVVAGVYLAGRAWQNRDRREWARLGLLVIGGTLVVFLTLLPYRLSGQPELWWGAVVQAPLAYSGEQEGLSFGQLPFYALVAAGLWLAWKRRWLDPGLPGNGLLTALLAGILLSFISGGKLNGHYLLQFYPLFLVVLFGVLSRLGSRIPETLCGLSLVLLLVVPVESYLEYGAVAANYREKGTLYNGEGIDVPRYLVKHYGDPGRVLFFEYHIGYWLLDTLPPSPAATHPSNICRPALYPYMPINRRTPEAEIDFLLGEFRPDFVICREGKTVFNRSHMEANASVMSYLQVYYQQDTVLGRAVIYKRL
ncbi:glycosyltransferase family 39 protein [Robiginitalea sp. SC105]|uniref:ArnT family glycosyltransferase n=1 Tax=Robiginitalea sp. SC105 TaxID=2762332 RepID=UPI00163AB1F7|nr:glycosyltransferase family 39 protein [Robiginitalea sp. SC105]MBC2837972.1 glycosyltransferase family 39 protein [Robiginitalea sp. SC105]